MLTNEINRYNYKRVHSTTGEVPYFRFKNTIINKTSLFREFVLTFPYKSTKDIFALRLSRIIDAYKKVSINNLEIKLNEKARETVDIRIYPLDKEVSEARFWCNNELIDTHKIKNSDLRVVRF